MFEETTATIKERAGFIVILTTEGKILLTEAEFEQFLKRGRTIES